MILRAEITNDFVTEFFVTVLRGHRYLDQKLSHAVNFPRGKKPEDFGRAVTHIHSLICWEKDAQNSYLIYLLMSFKGMGKIDKRLRN